MKVFKNIDYIKDVEYVAELNYPWEKFQNKSMLISGATGLVGSFIIDVIMKKNMSGLNCKIYALGRNESRAKERFEYCFDSALFEFISCDITKTFNMDNIDNVDYILHLASNTHPVQYSTDPIGTITTNIIGLKNLLDFAVLHKTKRFAFASSNEIYVNNRGDVEFFDENYCGYINSNTLRAGYPESKRCGESLCQAYKSQYDLEIVIPRLTRSYGPTMQMIDTKAISQFIKKGIAGENIVLKSEGNQFYSYTYVADAVSGLLMVLLCGNSGEAYNISDEHSDITLKDLASLIAKICEKKVIFEIPDEIESAGYSTAVKARLDGSKIHDLGWEPQYDIYNGIERTIKILKDIV